MAKIATDSEKIHIMSSIKKATNLNGTVWRVLIRKNGVRLHKTFTNKLDAQVWAIETEKQIINGILKPNLSLTELIEHYKIHRMHYKGKRTQQIQIPQLAHWSQLIGKIKVANITAIDINRAKQALLTSEREKATVNRYIQALSPVFSYALEMGYIVENPFLQVKKFKEPQGRVRYLTQIEMNTLLTTCKQSDSPHLYHIVMIALTTGMRLSEITTLKWHNIEFENHLIRLDTTKNGEQRVIPLVGETAKIIQTLPQTTNNAYLFQSVRTNTPILISSAFRTAVKRANLENFRFHDLRHTAASYLAMNGENHLTIASILGHKTLSMVKRYAHLNLKHTASALERLQTNYEIFLREKKEE